MFKLEGSFVCPRPRVKICTAVPKSTSQKVVALSFLSNFLPFPGSGSEHTEQRGAPAAEAGHPQKHLFQAYLGGLFLHQRLHLPQPLTAAPGVRMESLSAAPKDAGGPALQGHHQP